MSFESLRSTRGRQQHALLRPPGRGGGRCATSSRDSVAVFGVVGVAEPAGFSSASDRPILAQSLMCVAGRERADSMRERSSDGPHPQPAWGAWGPALQAWVVGFWRGPADLPDVLCQEWRFTVVRWPAILFVALGLPLAQLQSDQLWQAYGVLVFAGLYNTALTVLLRRQHPLLRGGYVSTALDAIMNLAMINIAGGFETPFYFIIYTVTVAAAMRYGYGASTLMAALFVSCDALSHPLAGRALTDGFFLRSGFLLQRGGGLPGDEVGRLG